MVRFPHRAAAVVTAAAALSTAAPAAAQEEEEPVLVAQIAQASPTPQPPPPLTEDPDLGNGEEPEEEPEGEPGGQEASPRTGRLPETGAEGALVALTGFGLLAAGAGLRLAVPTGDGRRA